MEEWVEISEERWNVGILECCINDGLVKSHIPYVVHASTSSARTEYQ